MTEENDIKVINEAGLHARPASILVKFANRFKSNITIICGNKTANAKSILSVLSLGAVRGSMITIRVDGQDEQYALSSLKKLIVNGIEE